MSEILNYISISSADFRLRPFLQLSIELNGNHDSSVCIVGFASKWMLTRSIWPLDSSLWVASFLVKKDPSMRADRMYEEEARHLNSTYLSASCASKLWAFSPSTTETWPPQSQKQQQAAVHRWYTSSRGIQSGKTNKGACLHLVARVWLLQDRIESEKSHDRNYNMQANWSN